MFRISTRVGPGSPKMSKDCYLATRAQLRLIDQDVIYGSAIAQQLPGYTIIVGGQRSKTFTSSYGTVNVTHFPYAE